MIQKIDKSFIKNWCIRNQIDLCILFGSMASGKTHSHSDTDIAISSNLPDLYRHKLRFISQLEDHINSPVDLTIFHQDMPLLLRYEIMTKGKPLYISNPVIYTREQVYAVKLFDDIAFLNKYQDLSLTVRLNHLKNVTANY